MATEAQAVIEQVPPWLTAKLLGGLVSLVLFLLGALGWAGKRLFGKLENQVDGLDEEVCDLHDRLLVVETNYKHCCGNYKEK